MDAVIRNAHRSLQSTERTRGPFRRTRREERRGSEEAMSHPLMSSASCMLSMRKANLQEVLLEKRNKALAKRVMNVKSFCDHGKDLEDYRRHQRMVQVRQEFHHYGGATVPPPKEVVPLSRPSRPRVARSLSESNLHHLNALLYPWDLPKAHRQAPNAEEAVAVETLPTSTGGGGHQLEVVPEETTTEEKESQQVVSEPELQLDPPAAASQALSASATPSLPATQMTPALTLATQMPVANTAPEALPALPALPALQSTTPTVTSFHGGLAPLSTAQPMANSTSPEVANNDQTVSETAVSPILDVTVQKEVRSEASPSQNEATLDASGPTLTQSTGDAESTTQPQPVTFDRHADPFGEMGIFDKPPEFKTKRRRERPAD